MARLSGDEFAILLIGARQRAPGGASWPTACIASLQHADRRSATTWSAPAFSIGLATSTTCAGQRHRHAPRRRHGHVRRQDRGKGRLEVFQPSHHTAQRRARRRPGRLSGALDAGQLELLLPADRGPPDRSRSSASRRCSAGGTPSAGLVSAAGVHPLAEETGLIVPIGRWVLQEATRQAAAWQNRSPLGRLRMSVNVSVRQFQHPDLVGDVAEALQRSGLDPSLLTLEITESLFAQDTEETARKIGQHQGPRRPPGARRLRHRLLVAELPAPVPDRHAEDRQVLHRRRDDEHRGPRRGRGHRASSARPCTWRSSPRGWRPPTRSRRSTTSAARSARATTSPGRWRAGDAVKLLLTGKKPAAPSMLVPA